MNYRYNVSCSETMSKNWTPSAVDCYKLGCVCSKCNLYKIYFKDSYNKCRMKENCNRVSAQIRSTSGG